MWFAVDKTMGLAKSWRVVLLSQLGEAMRKSTDAAQVTQAAFTVLPDASG
jgi:hypothetical protein